MFHSSNQYSGGLKISALLILYVLLLACAHFYEAWFLLSVQEEEVRCEMQISCIGLGASQIIGKTERGRCCCFGGFLLMGSTSVVQVFENFCLLLRHPAPLSHPPAPLPMLQDRLTVATPLSARAIVPTAS